MDEVNIEKSAKTGFLFYKSLGDNFGVILNYIMMVFFVSLFAIFLYEIFHKGYLFYASLLSIIPMLIISNMLFFNRLVKIEGANTVENRKRIIDQLNEKFNIQMKDNGEPVIRNEQSSFSLFFWSGALLFGRVITIIFNDADIYIHIQRLQRADALSAFHGLCCFLKARKIAKEFVK